MGFRLDNDAVQRLIAARHDRQMTQVELALESKISLRTIQMLETGTRNSFTESTLMHLCRVLKLDLNELKGLTVNGNDNGHDLSGNGYSGSGLDPNISSANGAITVAVLPAEPVNSRRTVSRNWLWLGAAALVMVLVASYWSRVEEGTNARNSGGAVDWVVYPASSLSSLTPDRQAWESVWKDKSFGVEFNRFDFPLAAIAEDTLDGIIQLSHHCFGVRPRVNICLFCEWNPNQEYHLYDGVVDGDSSVTYRVRLRCPDRPGLYRLRVFYGSAAAPLTNFFGDAKMQGISSEELPNYLEAKVSVMPQNYRKKLKLAHTIDS